MGRRIETFARGLEAINLRLAPRFLCRIDRRLLGHYPLAWRTSVHWVAWWSGIACAGSAAWGGWASRSTATLWSLDDLASVGIGLGFASSVACLIWSALRLRIPIGELPASRHVRLFFLNMGAVAILFLPAPAFSLVATYRIASSIPDADFHSELAFHDQHDYWRCSEKLTQAAVDANWPRLQPSLQRFGLLTDGAVSECAAGYRSHILLAWDASDPPPIKPTVSYDSRIGDLYDKLRSILASKELWRDASGSHAEDYWVALRAGAIVASLLALLIGVLSHPGYAWRRALSGLAIHRRRAVARRREAGRLARLDHKLLLTHPILWAAQLPWALVLMLPITVVVVAAAVLARSKFEWTLEEAVTNSVVLATLGWSYLWLATRRQDVAVVPTTPRIAMVASFFLGSLIFPILFVLFVSGKVGAPAGLEALTMFITHASFIVTICIFRTYNGRVMTVLFGSVSVFAVLVTIISSASAWATVVLFFLVWALTFLPAERISEARRISAMLAIMAPLPTSRRLMDFMARNSKGDMTSSNWAHAVFCLLIVPVCLIVFARPMTILARSAYEPKRE